MIVHSSCPNLVIPETTFSDFILSSLAEYDQEKPMLISAFEDRSYTCRQVIDAVVKCSSFLTRSGLKKGEVVALFCPNSLEYVIVFLATAACGGIITTCNPVFTYHEALYQFEDSKPKFVFTVPKNAEKTRNIASQLDCCKEVFMLEPCHGFRSFQELMQRENGDLYPKSVPIDVHKDMLALFYSSGTTGRPKGVMLSHYNYVSTLTISKVSLPLLPHDVEYLVLPTFHIYGMTRCFTVLVQGASLVIDQRFVLERMARAIEAYKVTCCPLVPPMLLSVAKGHIEGTYDLSSLRILYVGAAPISPHLVDNVISRFKLNLIQGWGMTEASGFPTIYNNSSWGIPTSSSGKPCPMNSVKIVSPSTGEMLGTNQEGEVMLKGPEVMIGYYNNPSASANAFDKDGFLHTGDIGYFDEEKNIYINDRLKELIKYKAFQVAPAELEHVLLSHAKIADAAVIGIPDVEAGELPKAFVVRRDPELSAAEVQSYVKNELSSYKHLRGGVEFVDVIPKSASGKILRRVLRDQNNLASKSKSKL